MIGAPSFIFIRNLEFVILNQFFHTLSAEARPGQRIEAVENDGAVGAVLPGAGHDQAADPAPTVEVVPDLR